MRGLRELARRAVVHAQGSPPLVRRRLAALARADTLIILNLHRVSEPDGSFFPPLAPAIFDALLGFAREHFSIVSLATMSEAASRPRLILSFDDGYRDFAETAMPILARYGATANQNVIPACAESGLPPLQVLAADFLGQAPRERIERIELPGFDFRDPRRLWPRLDDFLRERRHEEQREFASRLTEQFLAWKPFRPTPMMDRADIAAAAAAGHEIGGHGFDHATMALEPDDYLLEDVGRCARWIRDATGREIAAYAFPNGRLRPGQPERVREAGVPHVLLTGGGLGGREGIHDRVGFTASSLAELRFRVLGGRARI